MIELFITFLIIDLIGREMKSTVASLRLPTDGDSQTTADSIDGVSVSKPVTFNDVLLVTTFHENFVSIGKCSEAYKIWWEKAHLATPSTRLSKKK